VGSWAGSSFAGIRTMPWRAGAIVAPLHPRRNGWQPLNLISPHHPAAAPPVVPACDLRARHSPARHAVGLATALYYNTVSTWPGGRLQKGRDDLALARRSIVTKAARCSASAAFFFVLATFILAAFMLGLTPAMAVDSYWCRGDQACVKIAETTRCDRACQQACKVYRFDYVTCYSVWGPKLEFQREQQKRGIK